MMDPSQLTGQTDSHLVTHTIGERAYRLHPDIVDDLHHLTQAARQAGFTFAIASAFRDYSRQKAIWDGKFSGERAMQDAQGRTIDVSNLSEQEKVERILIWSALPGASRHHWGTDIDVYAQNLLPQDLRLQLEPWEYLEGHQRPFYQWLSQYAQEFGFFFPYARYQGGVAFEPWHLSHITTANQCLTALSESVLRQQIEQHPILGQACVLSQLPLIYTQFVSNICLPEDV